MQKFRYILSMLIFGSIGIVAEYINLPAAVIAAARAFVGVIFTGVLMLITRRGLTIGAVRRSFLPLIFSGICLGLNWVFLFEAYRRTGVTNATLCNYMAPVFVILVSPLILKEKLTVPKLVCTLLAGTGIVLVSGADMRNGDVTGIIFGLLSAVMYCGIVIFNKFIRDIEGTGRTFCQMSVVLAIIVPYLIIARPELPQPIDARSLWLLIVAGVVHTGVAYILFLSGLGNLPAQTSAVLSYIDPITAIILAALLLRQPLDAAQLAGAALVLGSALGYELLQHRAKAPPAVTKN